MNQNKARQVLFLENKLILNKKLKTNSLDSKILSLIVCCVKIQLKAVKSLGGYLALYVTALMGILHQFYINYNKLM